MIPLSALGAELSGNGVSKTIPCHTVEQALRLLSTVSDNWYQLSDAHRVRALAAVMDWINTSQQDHADELAGLLGLVADAGRRVEQMKRAA